MIEASIAKATGKPMRQSVAMSVGAAELPMDAPRLSRCRALSSCCRGANNAQYSVAPNDDALRDEMAADDETPAMVSRDSVPPTGEDSGGNGASQRFASAVEKVMSIRLATTQTDEDIMRRQKSFDEMSPQARAAVEQLTGIVWDEAVETLAEFTTGSELTTTLMPMPIAEIERLLLAEDPSAFTKSWNDASKIAMIKRLKVKLEPLIRQRNDEQRQLRVDSGKQFVPEEWEDFVPIVKRIATADRLQKALQDEPEAFLDELVSARQEVAQTIQRFWTRDALKKRDKVGMELAQKWPLWKEAMQDYASVWNGLDLASLSMLWTLLFFAFNDTIQVDLITMDAITSIATMFLVIRYTFHQAVSLTCASLVRIRIVVQTCD